MGPWQHKVDEGLDARKTAWETLYTLVSVQLSHKRSLLTTDVHITVGHLSPQTRSPDVPDPSPPRTHRSVGRDQSSRTPAPRTSFNHHTWRSSSPCTARCTHAGAGDDDARGTDHEGHGETGSRARGRVETKHDARCRCACQGERCWERCGGRSNRGYTEIRGVRGGHQEERTVGNGVPRAGWLACVRWL